MQNIRVSPEPAYTRLTSFEERHTVTPRPDAGFSVVKYRNASEFEAAGFRVKRGMTINSCFLKKLNEYKTPETSARCAASVNLRASAPHKPIKPTPPR